ncbi:MAG: ABC transporter ATP-binding protein [Cohaesibacteraceae bacterium]
MPHNEPIITVQGLEKTYDSGFQALKGVDLTIKRGEFLALLGPYGAGKSTLISSICGLTTPTGGQVSVGGHDILTQSGKTRRMIGLVPQEITIEPFEPVWNAVRFSRGLFGLPPNDAYLQSLLEKLSLWDKRESRIKELSGGMKRRVLIAKALSHEPTILFLDEPTAGVDVELRKDMWAIIRDLRESGVTIILTTHYIEEAEGIADRVAIISSGRILLVEDKAKLIERMGQRSLRVELDQTLTAHPDSLAAEAIQLGDDGKSLIYAYDANSDLTGIACLQRDIIEEGLTVRDVDTSQSSLEDIFVSLEEKDGTASAPQQEVAQ